MLAISVHSAINQAIASVRPGRTLPSLDAPATPERILMCIESLRRYSA
jgi:xanthine dehydrogenase large subunit